MNIGDVTLEQLMSEDYYVYIKNHEKFGYNMTLVSDEVEDDVVGMGIHPDAIESFASFCRAFLRKYEECQEEL